jgi:hypothetical protein
MGRLRFELRTNRLKANLDRLKILLFTGMSLRKYRKGTNDNLRHHKTPLWVPPCDTGPEYVLQPCFRDLPIGALVQTHPSS